MNKVIQFLKNIRTKAKLFVNKIGAKKRYKKLKNNDFTIISNNCFAGITYEYLNMPFYSPTIGLYFFAPEYIKFISNLKKYSKKTLRQINLEDSKYRDELIRQKQQNAIIGKLDDVEIVFLHYKNFKEAKEKWDRRCKRINFDKIIYKFNDQNLCTEKELKAFHELNLPNKICFTAKKYDYDGFIQLKKQKDGQVREDVYSCMEKKIDIIKIANKLLDKRPIVLHLLYSWRFSGAENVACSIIKNTENDINSVYCSQDGEIRKILEEKNIKFISINKINHRNIQKVIDETSPDFIHAHDFRASIAASRFYKRAKIISHIHKNDEKMKTISIKSILYAIASKRFCRIIGVSKSILDEYIFSSKIEDKFIVVPNYVDKKEVVEKSKEFKLGKKYDLFFLGRIQDEKNPFEFIEIVKELAKTSQNIKAVMIGYGPLFDKCEDKIKEYNLSKNISMVGYQLNPYPYIKNSKIGIMPSKYEGFGISVIEAAILGKPMLNSGVGGLKEICKGTNLICHNTADYVNAITNGNLILPKIDCYIDKKAWSNRLLLIYKEGGIC